MTTNRREQVLRLYHQALASDPGDRGAFLGDACAEDEELRRSVEALLAQDPPSGFLDTPAAVPEFTLDAAGGDDLIGQQVGPYRIDSRLGSGGMGHVFRAQDTKLGRDVAIKILLPEWSHDRERLGRFEREARVLATLNHPHVGAIYGLERVNGSLALVLELVEGQTLADHLARQRASGGGLPVQAALVFARQIADALEAAHEKGIVHRDLKPGNIKLTADGSVKVLDFGLASASRDSDALPDAAESAGVKDGLTRTGAVMGTAAYMSPEQMRGERVDKRADIWAFGCVLYQMLTGRQPFARKTAAETVAAILHDEPPWNVLPPDTPAAVRMALERGLRKDPKERLRDIGDVRLALTGAFTPEPMPTTASLPVASPSALLRRRDFAMLAIGGLATAVAIRFGRSPDTPPPVDRFSITTRGESAFHLNGNGRSVTVTPDGTTVVYVGDGGRKLFVRRLDQLDPIAIATSPQPFLANPFISPDGQWVGFNENFGFLKKVPIGGGVALDVTRVVNGLLRGAVWLPDDTIVFATNRLRGLLRVPAKGGEPATTLTTPDPDRNEYAHVWPATLPDGRSLLFTILPRKGGLAAAKTVLYDLEHRTATDLLPGGTNAIYLSSGHLAYIANGSLSVIAFDVERQMTSGRPVQALKQVATTGNGAGDYAVSLQGTLVYAQSTGYDPLARRLSWIDRQGQRELLDSPADGYLQFRISPDGTRVVYVRDREPEQNIWVWDLSRKVRIRVTTDAALDLEPAWIDDRSIVFASNREGSTQNLWRQAADGTGAPERLTHPPSNQSPSSGRPDGKRVLFTTHDAAGTDGDLVEMSPDGTGQSQDLVKTAAGEWNGQVSPDGRWLAYTSNRSGSPEVYVAPYSSPTTGRPVSTAGGNMARWSKDGTELFFLSPERAVMSVTVRGTALNWTATSPKTVLEPGPWTRTGPFLSYDVSPDGKRFLFVEPPEVVTPDLVVVQHWDQELKTLVASQ